MFTFSEKSAVWFGRGEEELMFYPFGIGGVGYRVPNDRYDEIAGWTFWRAQLAVILWLLGFVPLVDFWAPSLSDSGRLDARYLALALVVLTSMAWLSAWVLNRAIYSWLLKGCPILDRFPSRSEKQASSRQFGAYYKNIAFLTFPIATLGIVACALTMLIGAVREDLPLWAVGALMSATFWYAFAREGFE